MTPPSLPTSPPAGRPTPEPALAPLPQLPPRANQLGYAGLLPFVSGALLVWLVRDDVHPHVAFALAAYAALIVSFLGGIHWGLVMRSGGVPASALVWGVVPSLVAWGAVQMPPDAGLVVSGAMLIVCYVVDRRLYPRAGAGAWLVLRFRLSAVAAASCFIGAAGA